MIAAAIASVLRQQERMMDPVPTPERNSVLVVFENSLEDCAPLNVRIVIGIQTNK
jgi:hypothetical protein